MRRLFFILLARKLLYLHEFYGILRLCKHICYEKNANQSTLQRKDASLTLFIKNIYAFEYIIIYCDSES